MGKLLIESSTLADGNMSFRFGDTQSVVQNRSNFLNKHGIGWEEHVCMRCNHSKEIIAVNRDTQADKNQMTDAEVLVTQEKGRTLMLLTADCLPVVFHDYATQTLALAHYSRETIAAHLPEKTVSFLSENFSVQPADLEIHIGPHIGPASYKFPLPLAHAKPAIKPFIREVNDHAEIDLVAACNHQLITQGIIKENISVSSVDTYTSVDYFSHLRSKNKNLPDGRFATITSMSI